MYSMEAAALFGETKENKAKGPSPAVLAAYGLFGTFGLAVYHFMAEGEFSAILTLSVIMQSLAVVLLALQCYSTGSAAGISTKGLGLEALSLVCRLSSTVWLNGYLPVDVTGDYLFQGVDICTLVLLLWLLHRVLVVERKSYEADADSMPVLPVILGSFVLATALHADMNDRPFFDTLWMTGLFLGILAVLPQLWLISSTDGRIEAMTSHYIAAMALARVLSGTFMWHARFDLTCQPWVDGVNHASWAILCAHFIHLVLLGDFAHYYVKCVLRRGLQVAGHMDVCVCV